MNFAFIVDPLEGLKPAKDSSIAMMRAAKARYQSILANVNGSIDLSWFEFRFR